MSPAARVRLTVGALTVAVAGIVTGVVLATRDAPPQPKTQCPRGVRPLVVPGVRSTEIAAVRRALALPAKQAAVELAPVGERAPGDPVVQFNLGVVLFCAGYFGDAERAFRAAKTSGRDTLYEMRADEILHPQYFTPADGLYPVFEPTRRDPLLLRGVALQRQGRQHSALRVYERAVRLRPGDDEARVAAAVARFDEDNLSASFGRLGPLVRRFPRSQSARYHLGLLLAWTGRRAESERQFRLARSLGPSTRLGRESRVFLRGLVPRGTKGRER